MKAALKVLVHHRLLPREAAEFAKAIEPVGLFWLEDPTPADDHNALRFLRQHSTAHQVIRPCAWRHALEQLMWRI